MSPTTRFACAVSLVLAVGCGQPLGGPDAGSADAGPQFLGGGGLDGGCACGTGLVCLADGGCAECGGSSDCPQGRPCEQNHCATGCLDGAMCPSGVCLASGDCLSCQLDNDCSGGGRCGTGVCSVECVSDATCPGGWNCCGGSCVNPASDPSHCGSCQACTPGAFCAQSQCQLTAVSNLCRQPVVRVVLNAMAIDDQAGLAIGAALGRACSPAVTLLVGGQQDAGVLDVVSGAPLRTGELLVVGGGSFLQSSVRWFEKNALAPVVDTSTATHLQYSLRDGSVICTRAFSTISAAHDVFIVQVMMAPSGSLVFNAAGYYGPGTTAAGWYVVNSMVPNLATLTKAWYVVEWQDKAAGGVVGQPDAADTWTVLGSGV